MVGKTRLFLLQFNWKNKNNPDTKLGLIAQDLQRLIPEVVKSHMWEVDEETGVPSKKELDRLGVYYSDLVPVLIKAIQEQNQEIKSLKSTLNNKESDLLHQAEINENQSEAIQMLLKRIEALETSNN